MEAKLTQVLRVIDKKSLIEHFIAMIFKNYILASSRVLKNCSSNVGIYLDQKFVLLALFGNDNFHIILEYESPAYYKWSFVVRPKRFWAIIDIPIIMTLNFLFRSFWETRGKNPDFCRQ